MKREIITTNDGSKTIFIPEWNEHYHSKHGAIQEAKHVFLKHGLAFFMSNKIKEKPISIMEIGFGTGLNAFLTAIEAEKRTILCNYTGVEAFPVSQEELKLLDYHNTINPNKATVFNKIHECEWEKEVTITSYFNLKKQQQSFLDISAKNNFNIIFFDAFGPRVQPNLWTETVFKKMYQALKPHGVLVTYCAQGNARRAMIASGFNVEKVVGPPGKRHMLRAIKN